MCLKSLGYRLTSCNLIIKFINIINQINFINLINFINHLQLFYKL